MNGYNLEQALLSAVGETQEDYGYEWYEQYTGLNGFYHLLSGVDVSTDNLVEGAKVVTDGVVEVDGLGTFKRVDVFESNFDTYEKSWDNFLVFEFNGHLYRVQGSLDSHMGGIWDGRLEEVEPVEVKKTEYRRIG